MEELRGRVAVVTGAASGIGLGIARAFLAEGTRVVLADVDADRLEREVGALDPDAVEGVVCDVADPAAVERLAAAALGRFGAVHVICNNAGIIRGGRTWELPLADWDAVLRVNLLGVIHGVRTFVPLLLESGVEGHVVNVASMAAVNPVPGIGPYNVAKHGVLALSETLDMELRAAEALIGVTVVMPGQVPTRLGRASDDPTETDENGPGTLPPATVGRMVVDAVRAGRTYLFTHPERIPDVEARFARITAR
jgi:NAD(P)-dependent dehydrogenase (short-subunit alcohol dehydrogenase family)